jgi:L-alanine-DL-glutamate epimerase-like enolase superfamily enzyme
MSMNRRQFLTAAAATILSRYAFADDLPPDLKITRIQAFDLTTQRVKVVGKNARLDVHGSTSRDRLVLLTASDQTEGFANCHLEEKQLHSLLNKTPTDALKLMGKRNAAAYDLLGKITSRPARKLLAQENPPAVDASVRVYDGSIYFQDLLPDYATSWESRFKHEIDEILSRGHRAVKVKIGRGNKWMSRDEGDARDIAVLKLIRSHAGKDLAIAVDANNGYDLERTKRLIDSLPNYNFDFIEEMFPENIEQDLALKEFLASRKLKTLVADGETQPDVTALKPFMTAKAIDLYQLDVNQVGPDGLLEEAGLCHPHGGKIAPHTWGTLVGFYTQLHVARAIPNFYSGEQDPLASDAIIADGYTIKDGRCSVPDSPGFGLNLNRTSKHLKMLFDLHA